jgi:hypothetical protein
MAVFRKTDIFASCSVYRSKILKNIGIWNFLTVTPHNSVKSQGRKILIVLRNTAICPNHVSSARLVINKLRTLCGIILN